MKNIRKVLFVAGAIAGLALLNACSAMNMNIPGVGNLGDVAKIEGAKQAGGIMKDQGLLDDAKLEALKAELDKAHEEKKAGTIATDQDFNMRIAKIFLTSGAPIPDAAKSALKMAGIDLDAAGAAPAGGAAPAPATN